jgi:hypothetical protein
MLLPGVVAFFDGFAIERSQQTVMVAVVGRNQAGDDPPRMRGRMDVLQLPDADLTPRYARLAHQAEARSEWGNFV